MKTIIRSERILTIIVLTSLLSFTTYAANYDEQSLTCNDKKQSIKKQIDLAKKNNNINLAQGMEKALYEININCTNDKLEAKYKKEVSEKTAKVKERQHEFAEAQIKGNQQKIAKQKSS